MQYRRYWACRTCGKVGSVIMGKHIVGERRHVLLFNDHRLVDWICTGAGFSEIDLRRILVSYGLEIQTALVLEEDLLAVNLEVQEEAVDDHEIEFMDAMVTTIGHKVVAVKGKVKKKPIPLLHFLNSVAKDGWRHTMTIPYEDIERIKLVVERRRPPA